jgi:hypothetical protein
MFSYTTVMFVWFRYYKRAYEELFLSNDGKPADNSSEPSAQQASEHYRFGWLLFLSLRIQTNSRAKNLLTSTTELVSVLVRTPYYDQFHVCLLIFPSHATRQSMYNISQLVNNDYFLLPAGCTYYSYPCAAKELQYPGFVLLW